MKLKTKFRQLVLGSALMLTSIFVFGQEGGKADSTKYSTIFDFEDEAANKGTSTGLIIGIAAAALAGGGVIYFLRKKKKA